MTSCEEFWARCRAELPDERLGERVVVRRIGNSAEMCEQIIGLIVSGQKKGTYSLPDDLARAGTLPVVGDCQILTDFHGKPACLIRIDACDLLALGQIGPAELEIEGPGARDPEVWRAIHQRYWTPRLAELGQTWGDELPVLVQRFTLLRVA